MALQKWWFIRSILKYGSPLISAFEKKGIARFGAQRPEHPCVFIIGPPRSGSTIVYQVLTSLLDVSYVDNLANLARYNPYFGLWLSDRISAGRPHTSYTSRYGQTTRDGLHAPAEALFFYQWFPRDRHYTELSDLTPEQVSQFRQTIHAMINRHDRALFIKNLSFSLRLQVLREILPGARYIVVRRNPLYTAQSLLLAMRNHKATDGRVWGILPKDFKQLEGLSIHEMVVKQVHQIEKQIHDDLKRIPKENILYIEYEKLSAGLETIIGQVLSLCGSGVSRRAMVSLPDIEVKNRLNLPEEEVEILKSHIRPLDWELHNG